MNGDVSGIVVINKPENIHTGTIVKKVKKRFKVKVGHTGVIDYIGSGVVILLINRATKISDLLLNADKEYIFTGILGKRTDTMDITGNILEEKTIDSTITKDKILFVVQKFVGNVKLPVPPYSNKKLHGLPLYKLAIENKSIPPMSSTVTIYNIVPFEIKIPYFTFKIRCSKGTYIRSLVDSIGKELGTGATMYSLKRLSVGKFNLNQAIKFEDLMQMDFYTFKDSVIPLNIGLEFLPQIEISNEYISHFCRGNKIPLVSFNSSIFDGLVRVTFLNELLGLGKIYSYDKRLYIQPVKVLIK